MPGKIYADYPILRPPFWAQNSHIQTLAAFVLPMEKPGSAGIKHVVRLRDGDRLVIHDDEPDAWITGDRIAILVHGLCGCHRSSYMQRLSRRLFKIGIRTVRVDMRGFGDSSLVSTGHLHAGGSNDLLDVVRYMHQESPLSKITLIGFSLGANIVLKSLAELGCGTDPAIDSAIAVSPPIDLAYCCSNLRKFGNRFYDWYFTKKLSRGLARRRQTVEQLVDNGLNPLPDRLVHFDDQFTAPVNGYSGAREYYAKCSTIDRLADISIPTILVAAADDPVIPFDMFDPALFSSSIEFVTTQKGGHLGFLGDQPRDPDRHWLDWRICSWIDQFDRR